MATYLRDLASNALAKEAIPYTNSAAATTGSTQNFITADDRCAAMVQVSAISSAATLTITAQESTDGTTFTNVTAGSLAVTAAGIYLYTFDRTKQYLQFNSTITGSKTAIFGVVAIEQLKTY